MSDVVVAALAAFEKVKLGDKKAYRAALAYTERTVKDPLVQLAMVDSILAARKRAYSEVV
jgi:hypothetical protein